MSLGHVAIIGFGEIAQDLAKILMNEAERMSNLVREERVQAASAIPGFSNCRFTSDMASVLCEVPDVVVECAGHGAVAEFGTTVVSAGSDLVIASVGALSDPTVEARLEKAAQEGHAHCIVPAGAVGGVDALGAARISGLNSVRYTGRKSPMAWAGTPAENIADLATLTKPCVIFESSAREAAQAFPKNANVAAALALAGLGMDRTEVHLIADPATVENIHEYDVSSEALEFSVRLVGKPSPDNPKTSRSTVFSIARAVLNRRAGIVI